MNGLERGFDRGFRVVVPHNFGVRHDRAVPAARVPARAVGQGQLLETFRHRVRVGVQVRTVPGAVERCETVVHVRCALERGRCGEPERGQVETVRPDDRGRYWPVQARAEPGHGREHAPEHVSVIGGGARFDLKRCLVEQVGGVRLDAPGLESRRERVQVGCDASHFQCRLEQAALAVTGQPNRRAIRAQFQALHVEGNLVTGRQRARAQAVPFDPQRLLEVVGFSRARELVDRAQRTGDAVQLLEAVGRVVQRREWIHARVYVRGVRWVQLSNPGFGLG